MSTPGGIHSPLSDAREEGTDDARRECLRYPGSGGSPEGGSSCVSKLTLSNLSGSTLVATRETWLCGTTGTTVISNMTEVPVRIVAADDEPEFIAAAALQRKHFTTSQRAAIALGLAEYQQAEARARNASART